MEWGIQTWDANGVPNNYGLTPVTIVGKIPVGLDQVSGVSSFAVPAGFVLDYIQCPTGFAYTSVRRSITISGGTVTLGASGSSNFGFGSESAQAAIIVLFVRKP